MDNKIVVVVADSTGHGVPGAFMSMLGIAFFNEILAKEVPPSNIIVDKLRDKIKTSLRQNVRSGSPQDGMDLAIVVIDHIKKIIEFTGANNPLLKLSNTEVEQYKGDWMPVGIYLKEKPFSRELISYQNGDRIYLFTDGIVDQIGGPKNRKFMLKQLKTIISDTGNNTLAEQHIILEKAFDSWTADAKQLDDVSFIGIEL
jgi:serine phosphatase RsbU (regulator of sigma subunit)